MRADYCVTSCDLRVLVDQSAESVTAYDADVAGHMDVSGAVLDEEQRVQPTQEHRLDVEEVHRQDRTGLGGQERPQLGPTRDGAASIPASFKSFHTVDGATR